MLSKWKIIFSRNLRPILLMWRQGVRACSDTCGEQGTPGGEIGKTSLCLCQDNLLIRFGSSRLQNKFPIITFHCWLLKENLPIAFTRWHFGIYYLISLPLFQDAKSRGLNTIGGPGCISSIVANRDWKSAKIGSN